MPTPEQQAQIDRITPIESYSDVRRMVTELANRCAELQILVSNYGRRIVLAVDGAKPVLFAAGDERGECARQPTARQFAILIQFIESQEPING
jgi:hypothetical protein